MVEYPGHVPFMTGAFSVTATDNSDCEKALASRWRMYRDSVAETYPTEARRGRRKVVRVLSALPSKLHALRLRNEFFSEVQILQASFIWGTIVADNSEVSAPFFTGVRLFFLFFFYFLLFFCFTAFHADSSLRRSTKDTWCRICVIGIYLYEGKSIS